MTQTAMKDSGFLFASFLFSALRVSCGTEHTILTKHGPQPARDAMLLSTNASSSGVFITQEPTADFTRFQAFPLIGTTGNLSCFSCKLNFRKGDYNREDPCLGRHTNLNTDYVVHCGKKDRYCAVTATEVNGVLVHLQRECTDECFYGCRDKGFGIRYLTCTVCCNNRNGCNDIYPSPPYFEPVVERDMKRFTTTRSSASAGPSKRTVHDLARSGVLLIAFSSMLIYRIIDFK